MHSSYDAPTDGFVSRGFAKPVSLAGRKILSCVSDVQSTSSVKVLFSVKDLYLVKAHFGVKVLFLV